MQHLALLYQNMEHSLLIDCLETLYIWEHMQIVYLFWKSWWILFFIWDMQKLASLHLFFRIDKISWTFTFLQRYIADIGRAWGVLIVCGGIIPLFLSVIWLLLIRYFTAAMTWITVGTFNILIISVTIFYYLKGWCASL